MKTTIYLFTILLALNACKGKKDALAKEEKAKTETAVKKMTDAEKEAALIEQIKNEKPQNEAEDYYKMVEKEIDENAIARIQRTACFGRCPIYTLTVFEDGRVVYFGKKFTPREGKFEGKVSPDIIENLKKFAVEIGFSNFNNVYDKQAITDLPSTITSLRTDEELKTVVNRFDGPQDLRKFEDFFDKLFAEVEWKAVGE